MFFLCSSTFDFDQVYFKANNASIIHTIQRVAANPSQMAVQAQVCYCFPNLMESKPLLQHSQIPRQGDAVTMASARCLLDVALFSDPPYQSKYMYSGQMRMH